MNRKKHLRVLLIAMAILAIALPVSAGGKGEKFRIVVDEIFLPSPPPGAAGTFVATGAAVEEGLICPDGTSTELGGEGFGFTDEGYLKLLVHKRFTCNDLSGTIDVDLYTKIDFATGKTWGQMEIVGGTGDYSGVTGKAKQTGIPFPDRSGITDVYVGRAR